MHISGKNLEVAIEAQEFLDPFWLAASNSRFSKYLFWSSMRFHFQQNVADGVLESTSKSFRNSREGPWQVLGKSSHRPVSVNTKARYRAGDPEVRKNCYRGRVKSDSMIGLLFDTTRRLRVTLVDGRWAYPEGEDIRYLGKDEMPWRITDLTQDPFPVRQVIPFKEADYKTQRRALRSRRRWEGDTFDEEAYKESGKTIKTCRGTLSLSSAYDMSRTLTRKENSFVDVIRITSGKDVEKYNLLDEAPGHIVERLEKMRQANGGTFLGIRAREFGGIILLRLNHAKVLSELKYCKQDLSNNGYQGTTEAPAFCRPFNSILDSEEVMDYEASLVKKLNISESMIASCYDVHHKQIAAIPIDEESRKRYLWEHHENFIGLSKSNQTTVHFIEELSETTREDLAGFFQQRFGKLDQPVSTRAKASALNREATPGGTLHGDHRGQIVISSHKRTLFLHHLGLLGRGLFVTFKDNRLVPVEQGKKVAEWTPKGWCLETESSTWGVLSNGEAGPPLPADRLTVFTPGHMKVYVPMNIGLPDTNGCRNSLIRNEYVPGWLRVLCVVEREPFGGVLPAERWSELREDFFTVNGPTMSTALTARIPGRCVGRIELDIRIVEPWCDTAPVHRFVGRQDYIHSPKPGKRNQFRGVVRHLNARVRGLISDYHVHHGQVRELSKSQKAYRTAKLLESFAFANFGFKHQYHTPGLAPYHDCEIVDFNHFTTIPEHGMTNIESAANWNKQVYTGLRALAQTKQMSSRHVLWAVEVTQGPVMSQRLRQDLYELHQLDVSDWRQAVTYKGRPAWDSLTNGYAFVTDFKRRSQAMLWAYTLQHGIFLADHVNAELRHQLLNPRTFNLTAADVNALCEQLCQVMESQDMLRKLHNTFVSEGLIPSTVQGQWYSPEDTSSAGLYREPDVVNAA
jgi:hypothetical protein